MRARGTLIRGAVALATMGGLAVAGSAVASAASTGTWTRLPSAPLALAPVQTAVWTGHEALFTYPTRRVRRAVGYTPTTGRWRALPAVAGPPYLAEGGDRSVWTGRDWLVSGQVGFAGLLAYRPATNRWRALRVGALGPANATVVWSGRQMLAWGGGCCAEYDATGTVYTPGAARAVDLPVSPLRGRQGAMGAWTGTAMIVVGGRTEVGARVIRDITLRDGAAYVPGAGTAPGRWRPIAPMPRGRADATATWTGRDLIVVGGVRQGTTRTAILRTALAYRPSTGRWRALAPMPRGRTGHVAVWTGSRLVVWGGTTAYGDTTDTALATGVAYDPAADRWTSIGTAPVAGRAGAVAVWTGGGMIVAGGGDAEAAFWTP